MGSPIAVPDSIVLGRLSKPSGARPSNPWTVTGSVLFLSCFSKSLSASLGGLLSFWVQEEPPSLRTEREGDQEFLWFFKRPSRILFAQKEGWNMPGYPWWARAVTLPVSCYRVSPSGGPCPIR